MAAKSLPQVAQGQMAFGGWVDWAQGGMPEAESEWAGQRVQGGDCHPSTVAPEGVM